MQVGDFVRGIEGNGYGITNEKMTKGLVVDVTDSGVTVRVLEHEEGETGVFFDVKENKVEIIGHQKEFNRNEVLKLLNAGNEHAILDYDLRGADLRGADLQGADLQGADLQVADLQVADLQGADLDFSCLALSCGGLNWKIDKRLACQLAYHFCSMKCDDEEFLRTRQSMLDFANQFHRKDEYGTLK